MKDLFLTVVEISLSAGLVISVMLIFSSYLNRRYAAKWKYLIWIMVALRLVIPVNFKLPAQKIVVDVPERMTAPVNVGAAVPLMLQAEHGMTQITLLDIAAWLWFAGCLLFLSVHLLSFWHFRKRMLRDGERVRDENILRLIRGLSGELRIKRDIRVMRYPDAGSPMLIGFSRPVLVLPDCGYSEEELCFILKHELIHLKRHDIYFKLLLVAANAVHWFNPLVYAMQKDAVIDMELSCDERVVRQTSYAVRKAYTETLFSTLSRQNQKGTALTTQFYGGKKVMKKRFKNILRKTGKRNGAVVSICALCLTLVSGMFVGCSASGSIASGVQAKRQQEQQEQQEQAQQEQTRQDQEMGTQQELTQQEQAQQELTQQELTQQTQIEAGNSDTATESLLYLPAGTNPGDGQTASGQDADSRDGQTVSGQDANNGESRTVSGQDTNPGDGQTASEQDVDSQESPTASEQDMDSWNGQTVSGQDTNNGESREVVLWVESGEIINLVDEFAAAYFSKDVNAVKSLLPDSYAWDIYAYEGKGTISDMAILGVPDAEEQAAGDVLTVSLQYRDSTYEDMFQYLTFELVRQDTGWEIQFYGVEG